MFLLPLWPFYVCRGWQQGGVLSHHSRQGPHCIHLAFWCIDVSSPSTLQVRSGPEYTGTQGPLRLLPRRPARAGRGLPCSEAEAASPAADAHTDAHSSASMEEATEGASCCSGSEMLARLLVSASPAPSCNQATSAPFAPHPIDSSTVTHTVPQAAG